MTGWIMYLFLIPVFVSFFTIQCLCIAWMLAGRREGKLTWLLDEEKVKIPDEFDWPHVSILLAARNEEELIIRSLEAIEKLEYPRGSMEVLIGNDASTDGTEDLIRTFIQGKSQFRLINIEQTLGKARGKANVLAQLAHEAKGEYYLITDVDVKLPPLWIKRLIMEFEPDVALVSGTTMCERGTLFATMQSIDWLHFMGYIKAFAKVGISCTSVGNNMAVRAEAYWQTGGYENIEFSITEDYKLFKEVTQGGWGWRNILDEHSLGKAWYINKFSEMLHQRKRWLIGARELPWNWKAMIILYGLFLPALFVLFFIDAQLAIKVWLAKSLVQFMFISILAIKAGLRPFSFGNMIIYEFYVVLNTLATAIFYVLPIPSRWKGRTYNAAYLEEN